MSETIPIRIAHSPDSDDAFMFYAMTQGLLDTEGLEISHVLQDIETLNQAAFEGKYEITALSVHGYAYLADRYSLMPSGASFGDGYGPVVVAKEPMSRDQLAGVEVAIPGQLTTAHLALKLWQPQAGTAIVPFDRILDVVESGEYAAGVVIHEGQLTYEEQGLVKIVDVGAWWQEETGGPLAISLRENGPLFISGNVRIVSADGSSAWEGTRTALCRCGMSKNKPFCDGTHRAQQWQAD